MTSPLLRLLGQNLLACQSLEMLDATPVDLQVHVDAMAAGWDAGANLPGQRAQFESSWQTIQSTFAHRFRPIQAFRNCTVPLTNVMRVESFANRWLPRLHPRATGDRSLIDAWRLIENHVRSPRAMTSTEGGELSDAFLRLNAWVSSISGSRGRRGLSLRLGTLLRPEYPFWVCRQGGLTQTGAQFWRDRLGLIHIDEGSRRAADLLIRVRFSAELDPGHLDRNDHLSHRAAHRHGLWLFRPSVMHANNVRFVQGVRADRKGRPARRGATRDISNTRYPEGDRELLMLAGELADSRMWGFDLLQDFAQSNPALDLDDGGFVSSVAAQLNWP